MKNETNLEFTDIKSEIYRIYVFDNGFKIKIISPLFLNVNDSGAHRIFDESGKSHYIPKGWVHLYWVTKEGFANFVK